MARLNSRPSTQTAEAPTPDADCSSDQENHDPRVIHSKRSSQRPMEPPTSPESRLPTPDSNSSATSRGTKRKRIEIQATTGLNSAEGDNERRFNRYYDPDQNADERRQHTRDFRELERRFNENRDEYLKEVGGNRLKETISQANDVFKSIKQTNDATVDSRLLVNVSDLAYKKSAQLVLGDTSTGIDVDLFLSKCITFMRNNGSIADNGEVSTSRSQRMRPSTQNDDENSDNETDELDWGVLGQHACFPYNARPPVPSFLLGPLSVQKKQRVLTQRRARQAKDSTHREERPEALTREDLSQSDENTLTAICSRIKSYLVNHIERAEQASAREGLVPEDIDTDRGRAFAKKHRVASTGGPSLFDYVINPFSFGQTVENMFYVSFLIKEGAVGVWPDEHGLPTLLGSTPRTLLEQRRDNVQKHQAVFAIDYATWQELIEAFDIREPLIPHRQEESATQIGSRGWYT